MKIDLMFTKPGLPALEPTGQGSIVVEKGVVVEGEITWNFIAEAPRQPTLTGYYRNEQDFQLKGEWWFADRFIAPLGEGVVTPNEAFFPDQIGVLGGQSISVSYVTSATPVPVPSSGLLGLVGALAIALVAQRFRRHRQVRS